MCGPTILQKKIAQESSLDRLSTDVSSRIPKETASNEVKNNGYTSTLKSFLLVATMSVLFLEFSMWFPFNIPGVGPSALATYVPAWYHYDTALTRFDNSPWTYNTDYLLTAIMSVLAQYISGIYASILDSIRGWRNYFAGKESRILLLGLDNAGKTTFMRMVTTGQLRSMEPTRNATTEEFEIFGNHFRVIDLGGHFAARRLWTDYFHGIDGVMYIVDASDHSRLNESMVELHSIATNEILGKCPLMILGNKIDIPGACSEYELREALQLHALDGRKMNVFMMSIAQKTGIQEALRWFSDQL